MGLIRLVHFKARHAKCLVERVTGSIVGHRILSFNKGTDGGGDHILRDILLIKTDADIVARDPLYSETVNIEKLKLREDVWFHR